MDYIDIQLKAIQPGGVGIMIIIQVLLLQLLEHLQLQLQEKMLMY